MGVRWGLGWQSLSSVQQYLSRKELPLSLHAPQLVSGLFSVVQVFDPGREVGIILPSSPPSSPFPHVSPHSQLSLTNFTLSSLPPPHPFNLTRSLLPPTSPFLQHHTLSPLSHLICLLVDPNQPVFCCICLIQVLQPNILVANLHISCPIVPRWAGVVNLCIVGVTYTRE